MTVVVTDNGLPVLSDSTSFTITVDGPDGDPQIITEPFCSASDVATLTWTDVNVDSYLVEFDTDEDFGNSPFTVASDVNSAKAQLTSLDMDVVYHYRVITVVNGVPSDTSSNTQKFRRWPAQIPLSNSLAFPTANKSEDFRMISVPGESSVVINATFSGQQAAPGPLLAGGDWGWSVWRDNKNGTQSYPDYVENPTTLGNTMFEPGVGYWAITTSAWEVSEPGVNSVTLQDTAFFAIPLNVDPQSRWTMIGNPFDFPVAWQDILDANPGATGQLKDWTGGPNYQDVTILQPYKGYYFFNADNRAQLNMPCFLEPATGGKVTQREAPALAALKLSLHEDATGIKPALSDATISWREEAETGFDRFDNFTPPTFFGQHRVMLVNEELEANYAYLREEARPMPNEAQHFDLKLHAVPGEVSYLHVEGLASLADQEVYLFNQALGQSFDLHKDPVVLLEPDQEISELRLLVGDAAFIASEKSQLVPEGFKMQQSYPNPFIEQTTIEFALPDPEFVTLEIYNILGQRVRTLVHGEQDAGYHRVVWDGRSESGDEVASGMYLYVFTSPSQHATQRMVRVR